MDEVPTDKSVTCKLGPCRPDEHGFAEDAVAFTDALSFNIDGERA
jgi:hypothetical protein